MAYEDWTTWDENDTAGELSVAANQITGTVVNSNGACVDKNFGTDYFSGEFTHYIDVYVDSYVSFPVVGIWAISVIDDWTYVNLSSGGLCLYIFPSDPQFYIERNGDYDAFGSPSLDTRYYIKIVRDFTNYVTVYVYSDAGHTNLLWTSIPILYAEASNYISVGSNQFAGSWTGYLYNLDVLGSTLDNFNRIAENPLSFGGKWTNQIRSGDVDLKTDNTQAMLSTQTSQQGSAYWDVATFGPDCESFVTINVKPDISGRAAVLCRLASPGTGNCDGYLVVMRDTGVSTQGVYRYDNDVQTLLGAAVTPTWTAGDRLRITADGSTIKMWQYTGGSWSELASRTDTTYSAAGYIGFDTGVEGTRLDNFGGGTIAEGNIEEAVSLSKFVGISNNSQINVNNITTLNKFVGISNNSQINVNNITILDKFAGIDNDSQINIVNITTLDKFAGVSANSLVNLIDNSLLDKFNGTIIGSDGNLLDAVLLSNYLTITTEGIEVGLAIEESIDLGLILRVTQPLSQNIEESVTLVIYSGISNDNQIVALNEITLNKVNAEGNGDIANVIDLTTLAKIKAIQSATNTNENDLVSLLINKAINLEAQTNENDFVSLGNINTLIPLSQTNENDAAVLTKFIDITVLEETQGFVNETVALVRFVAIEVLEEGISHVSEEVSISRSAGINEITECQVNDDLILNRLTGINEILERYVNDSTILDRLNGISETAQCEINDNAILDRLNSINEELERYVNDAAILDRLIGIYEIAECQVNDDLILNRLSGISEAEQCQVNNDLILNRLSGISEVEQCQVNNTVILAKFVRIIIIDETIGQYAESVIFHRFVGLTAFEEGISHVSEEVSVGRLNTISINWQSELYNSLIFNRLNGLTILPGYQLFNNLLFSRSNGLSINAQNVGNENITVSKFNGLNANSQIIVPEFINLSQLYDLAIFDSRYLLESISLQYSNGLSLIDSPSIFEVIELEKINILTIITMLYGFNSIAFNQFKFIIAEPPSLYVYNDGNHSIGVLFRDKRLEVLFRDKRASTYWRDKREGN